MTTQTHPGQPFFNSLQVYRGLAALLVIFHHEWTAFVHFFDAQSTMLDFLGGLGKYGVDFFFVLSGFIITYSNYEKGGMRQKSSSYFLNRVLRIYLPYLPISILLLFLYYYFPAASEGKDRDISLLTSLTLVPHGKPALSVAWTLVHEMMFYLLFLSWFYSKRAWYILVAAWAMVIIILNYGLSGAAWRNDSVLSYLFSFYNLEFILGFVLAILFKKTNFRLRTLRVLPGLVVLGIAAYLKWITHDDQSIHSGINLVFALGFGLIIYGSLGSALDRLRNKSLLMTLGNASYSIYLVHNLCISILIRVTLKYLPDLQTSIVFVVIFVLCCVAGVLYSKVFEEFLLKKAKARLFPAADKARKKENFKIPV
jgi:exopolysaccharide production protein ExoZ